MFGRHLEDARSNRLMLDAHLQACPFPGGVTHRARGGAEPVASPTLLKSGLYCQVLKKHWRCVPCNGGALDGWWGVGGGIGSDRTATCST